MNEVARPEETRTEREWLEAFRRGERVKNSHALDTFPHQEKDCGHPTERTLICVDDRDVVECSRCGRQRETACNFDEEYS